MNKSDKKITQQETEEAPQERVSHLSNVILNLTSNDVESGHFVASSEELTKVEPQYLLQEEPEEKDTQQKAFDLRLKQSVRNPPPTALTRQQNRNERTIRPGAVAIAPSTRNNSTAPREEEQDRTSSSASIDPISTTTNQRIVEAFAVSDHENPEQMMQEAEERARKNLLKDMVQGQVVEKQDQQRQSKKRCWMYPFLIGIILLVVLLATLLPGKSKEFQPTPLTEQEDVLQRLASISNPEDISNSTTPQYQAYNWLFDENGFGKNPELFSLGGDIVVERYILAVLYFSTAGSEWDRQDLGFLSNASVCEWPPIGEAEDGRPVTGVRCDSTGHVSRIRLDSMNLNGTIPSELGGLPFLRSLSMVFNNLTGTLPEAIGYLKDLEDLELDGNNLNGTIPNSFGNLDRLKTLRLGEQRLSGTIPSGILSTESLRILYLSDNLLNGTIPKATSQGSMVEMSMEYNLLTGTIPSSFYTLERLEMLNLGSNYLSGTISTLIGNLVELEAFYLPKNLLNGTIPTELGQLTSLQHLWINENYITGSIPSHIGELGKFGVIQAINLLENDLTGQMPEEWNSLTSLMYFDIAHTSITGSLDPAFCYNNSRTEVFADCRGENPEVECSCCVGCCQDGQVFAGFCDIDVELSCELHMGAIQDPQETVYWFTEEFPLDPSLPSCECAVPDASRCTEDGFYCEVHALNCTDTPSCEICDRRNGICGHQVNVGRSYDADSCWLFQTWGFQYTSGGRNETILFELDIRESAQGLYNFYVDGVMCNSAVIDYCGSSSVKFAVDCSNIDPDAVYSQCEGFVEDAGFLHYLTPTMWRQKSSCDV